MTALALFVVLVAAKLAAMSGHGIPLSAWSLVIFTWQDAIVAAAFGMLHRLIRGRSGADHAIAILYWTLVAYAAVNIPIGRALGTPLTSPMLRATRGALADSLLLHVTWTNVCLIAFTGAVAAALPGLLRRLPLTLPRYAALCGVLLFALAPLASSHVDLQGRHRTAVIALAQTSLPQIRSSEGGGDWRMPPLQAAEADDLTRLRGAAHGLNVIVVSLESTAAQYLPFYGGPDDVMPALSALARNAIVFDRAYAAYPESIKGLFSTLCSTFPAFDVAPDILSRAPCAALPARLRTAGYATGLFHTGRFNYLDMEGVIADRGFDVLEDAGDIGGDHESSFGVDEPSTIARMLAWVDAAPRERPFFLMYLPIAGHHPYDTPSPGVFPNDDEFERYRNALRYGDAAIGALAEGLRSRGLDHKTLWVVFGDHGEAFGQHEGNYGHTFFLYDENVRVPLIIAGPAVVRGEKRVTRVVSLVDLAPTILDLLGLPTPSRYQGHSMLDGLQRMALFFTDYSLPLAGLVDGRWKAVHDLDTGRTRVFDLVSDPDEAHDVSDRAPVRAAWYADTLKGWSAAQKHYLLEATARRP